METKVCPKCGRELPLSDFYNNISKKDGKDSICKECDKENRKKYYENNREKILEYQKEYYENNKGRRNKHKKEYAKNRRKEDELFAVTDRCRVRLRKFIRYGGYKKTSKTFEMIGCTPEQLLEHLHKTWYDNYGTEYNGEPVHIDHIIPLSSAKTEEDIYKLCHYSNLQYLKPEDNLAKSDSILQTI